MNTRILGWALMGVVASMAVPSFSSWTMSQNLTASSRSIDAAFSYARDEAVRTGNIHLVFLGTDADGATLTDARLPPKAGICTRVTSTGIEGAPRTRRSTSRRSRSDSLSGYWARSC